MWYECVWIIIIVLYTWYIYLLYIVHICCVSTKLGSLATFFMFPSCSNVHMHVRIPKDDKLAVSFTSYMTLNWKEKRDNDLRLRTTTHTHIRTHTYTGTLKLHCPRTLSTRLTDQGELALRQRRVNVIIAWQALAFFNWVDKLWGMHKIKVAMIKIVSQNSTSYIPSLP